MSADGKNWLVIGAHLVAIIAVNVIPYVSWDARILSITLFVLVSASAQWHILDQCVFSKLENGSEKSIFVVWLQHLTGLDYKTLGKWWVFLLNYVPSVACILKLYVLANKNII